MTGLWPEQFGEFYCETCDWFHKPDAMSCPSNAWLAIRGLLAMAMFGE